LQAALHLNFVRGDIVGRVVKASLDHVILKTFEVTIQNQLDNSFSYLSVDDPQVFDALVRAMMSGRILKIGYIRLFGLQARLLSLVRGYDTADRIVSVDSADSRIDSADSRSPFSLIHSRARQW
jgi:hypothetical protein